ncbi:MAG: hypothetical protein AAGM22_23330 [Acidobacteriota bacterium]
MSSTIYFKNETSTDVTFGLFSAPNKYVLTGNVGADDDGKQTMDHPDARTVAAWITSNVLYPNNDSAFVEGFYFKSGTNYQVTLTTEALTIEVHD